jgi:oligopeptide/dipeptide ABC transporter ATP-binding protein
VTTTAADTRRETTEAVSPLLSVRDLHVSFTGRVGLLAGKAHKERVRARAVDGVSLDIAPGEILALAGESGCGKTTLARAIMGFVRPDAGEILYEGRPVRDLRTYRRSVQMVYQDPMGALNPRQTIYESVAEGLRIHKVPGDEEKVVAQALSRAGLRPPERFFLSFPHELAGLGKEERLAQARRALEMVDLADRVTHKPNELSGGQRQRVVIAGALALEPRLIVADEPVSNLDASIRGEILQLLLRLRKESGMSILVVTHDLGLAWTVADRVAVMYLGRIVELGPTRRVLTEPLHPYTRALLAVVPEAGGIDRPALPGEPPDPTRIPPGCRFHPRCPALASGESKAAGVDEKCVGEDLGLMELEAQHSAACHLTARQILAV